MIVIIRPLVVLQLLLWLPTYSLAQQDDAGCFRCLDGSCLEPEWVCDGEVQCPHPDDSDEKRGCSMFPETGCKSWYGKKHQRCPGSDHCVLDLSQCPPERDKEDKDDEGRGTKFGQWCEDGRFRCRSGMCVDVKMACNRVAECDDGTDETDGCHIYDHDKTHDKDDDEENIRCLSWFGKEHVPCANSSVKICTLPEFSATEAQCRMCLSMDMWRCNDGFCIDSSKVQNGIKNCPDGSDEPHDTWTYWNLIVVTFFVALTGVLLSFLYRLVKRRRTFFDCNFCHSKRVARLQKDVLEMTLVDSLCSASMREASNSSAKLPMELIDIFEMNRNWRESNKSLLRPKEAEAKQLYARVHCDPVCYKNLYRYLFYRFATPRKLSGVTAQLLRWEEEFHGNDRVEALACWRLHLGSSDVLRAIVRSVQEPGLVGRFYDLWVPVKDAGRKHIRGFIRSKAPESTFSSFHALYSLWNTAMYLIKPFVGAAFLYFDIFKDIVFTHLIYISIMALTKGELNPRQFPFEFSIMVGLGVMFIINLVIWTVISVYYSQDVFEMCQHSSSKTKIAAFKVLSLILAFLMPAFLLANYVYYLQLGYSQQRRLQTTDDGGNYAFRTKQFMAIEKTRYRAKFHRRLYSFFRVTTAVVQSFNMIVVLVVIVVVSGRPGRDVNLVRGVTEKIVDFFQMSPDSPHGNVIGSSVLRDLDLVWSVAIMGSILYSLLMILSALVRYIYQSKDQNLIITGKVFLSFYFTCHIVSRLTVFIAIISTSEPTPLPDGTVQQPIITLFPAILLGLIIFITHFILIAWYKHSHVANFTSASDPVQRFIHILVNTLVAIPYSKWDVDIPSSSDEDPMCHRTLSMPARIPNDVANQNGSRVLPPPVNVPTRRQSDSMLLQSQAAILDQPCVTFPNVSPPLMAGVMDLRAKMESLWWRNPSKEITLQDVREGCGETVKLLDEEAVTKILGDVVDSGFVNKKGLYIPQKTKREYFWLFVFHLVSSGAAITIEVINGGVRTKSGLYISWDIRLASFFLGLIFLALYYRRYHALRDLTSPGRFCNLPEYIPVVCCIKDPEPLTAAPVEAAILEQLCKPLPRGQGDGVDTRLTRPPGHNDSSQSVGVTVETQTSIIERPEEMRRNKQCHTML